MWTLMGPQITKTILKKKKNVVGLTLPDFKTYYKVTVIKTLWNWHKDKHIDQWNRIESLEITPHIYGQTIFNKGANTIHGERTFSTSGAGKTGYPFPK